MDNYLLNYREISKFVKISDLSVQFGIQGEGFITNI